MDVLKQGFFVALARNLYCASAIQHVNQAQCGF